MAGRWITESKGNLDACLGRIAQGVAFRETLTGDAPRDHVPYAGPLLDAVALFEELSIGYALVGGVASMYYGRARFTEDVDFVADTGHRELLGTHLETMQRHRFDPTYSRKLYHSSGVEIDIWKDEHSDSIVERATEVQVANRVIRIAEPHDLIAMKLRAGRIQDDYDVSEIIKGTPVDDAVIQSRVTPAEFAHYAEIKRRVQ